MNDPHPEEIPLTCQKPRLYGEAIIEPLLAPAKPGGRPHSTDLREGLNAIFYLLRAGCAWRLLPHDFPKWPTVYTYFCAWQADGTWQALNDALRQQLRRKAGRQPHPSAACIDSQSVKTAGAAQESGFDGGKKVKGRKRTILEAMITATTLPIPPNAPRDPEANSDRLFSSRSFSPDPDQFDAPRSEVRGFSFHRETNVLALHELLLGAPHRCLGKPIPE